jgi:glutathione peroxidase
MRTEKLLSLVAFIVFSITVSAQSSDFYNFKVKTLEGENFDFSTLKGKKVMIVNVASKCGNTPQYKDLEEMYEKYKDDNFVIIGFPANNFMNQEPGTASEIRKFCTENYGVTFPLMEKISVKGDDMHPLYQWLTSKQKNGVMDAPVTWNFQKFLIDESGKLIEVIPPKEKVTTDKVIAWISK